MTKIPKLRILGRDSAAALKSAKDRYATAQQLKVNAFLAGTVRKTGNQLRLTAQLINVADGSLLWSETYDRAMAELFGIQTEVAEKVGDNLGFKISETVRTRLAIKPTKNLEAYQLYLEGRYHWTGQPHRAIEIFQSAIRLDPIFAAAYAGLADCYIDGTREKFSGREAFPKALVNATTAVELGRNLAETHSSLARIKSHYEYDWDGAGKEFQLAIRLNPADGRAQQWYSQYLDMMGRFAFLFRCRAWICLFVVVVVVVLFLRADSTLVSGLKSVHLGNRNWGLRRSASPRGQERSVCFRVKKASAAGLGFELPPPPEPTRQHGLRRCIRR